MNGPRITWLLPVATVGLLTLFWLATSADTPEEAIAQVADKEALEDGAPPSSHRSTPRPVVVRFAPAVRLRQPRSIALQAWSSVSTPRLDGVGDDIAWRVAEAVTTLDGASQRPITLQSVHDGQQIYFLVSYADPTHSVSHKTWRWDRVEGVCGPMSDREDTFVFAWSMDEAPLPLRNAQAHRADIWFWKAWRTNPVGYADDKHRIVDSEPREKSVFVGSAGSPSLYLEHRGDAGLSAYIESLVFDNGGPYLSRYSHRSPQGGRADFHAVGRWADGVWTIEFARDLNTGHDDDVAFTVGGRYRVAVSCYQMAEGDPQVDLYRPLYKTGDVFDRMTLEILP